MQRTVSIWALAAGFAVLFVILNPAQPALAGSSAKKRGAELFHTKGCDHCHGPAGVGGGKGPDLQLVRTRRTRDQILNQIHDGGKSMPDFGDKLTADQINDLASFLLSKRKYIPVPPKPAPKPTPETNEQQNSPTSPQ